MWKSSWSFLLLIIFLMNASFTNLPGKPAPAHGPSRAAKRWADSVLKTLNPEQRIAQLLMVRAHSNLGQEHVDAVTRLVRDEGVGGLVFFQGGPVRQAVLTNFYQSLAKVPLMIGIDGEWGLGMRLDSVLEFPRQMELGAISDPALIYETGVAIGKQCRRMGIQIDFAPVVDVNSDPGNPVIGDRSYGESRERVALLGTQYMLGLQSQGIIACAKHFPGHGDTRVDSHQDLPVITRTRAELDQTELYPFRALIQAGVDAVMVAHLSVPSIDPTPHLPTSLSRKAVHGLLQHQMHFKGLVFTDALEMKGVTRYFGNGEAAVRAFQAGNDVLTLPEDVPQAIRGIQDAANHGTISWRQINARVKKILIAKFGAGLSRLEPVDTVHLVRDLNEGVADLHRILADSALTVLSNENRILPLQTASGEKIAYLGVGLEGGGSFAGALGRYHPVASYSFPDTGTFGQASLVAQAIKAGNDQVIIGLHGFNRYPENDFGLTQPEIQLILQLEEEMRSVTVVFGNPYALRYFSQAPALVEAYEDDSIMHEAAASLLFGKSTPSGTLPVTTSSRFSLGSGLKTLVYPRWVLPSAAPSELGMDPFILSRIDTIAREAIDQGATPGCVVLAARDGKIFFDKAYGTLNYEDRIPVNNQTVYDMASCTKICATTMACMRLYDQGKLGLDKTLGDYLPWLRGTDKADLRIRDVMMHQARLVAFIPFYKETLTDGIHPNPAIYSGIRDSVHSVRVAENMYMRKDWLDTMDARIRDSRLGAPDKYVYSDNDFILMARIVEQITGQPINQYVQDSFYNPLGMASTGFLPRQKHPLDQIAPTECEKYFRMQCLHGDVHDPGSAMFGEVAGHAGLFSDAGDLAVLMQMMLNGGTFNGVSLIRPGTIKLFTSYDSKISRRGLGWDKPQLDRSHDPDPYPCRSCSPLTYGHTGYTGTCIWVDPKYNLIFIFLSNRVCPDGGVDLKLSTLDIRSRIQQTLYDAMKP